MSVCLLTGLSGCGDKAETALPSGAYENEIVTTTPVNQEKTLITVRVEFGVGQRGNMEEILEEKFPNVDIVLRHDGATNSLNTITADLEAGVGCDLILSRNLTATADIASDYLLDLSSEEFVNNYYMNAVDSCTNAEGKLYYLPGPSDVYGIVYDKTLFDENGWEVPQSYTEFKELIETINEYSDERVEAGESAIVPLQVSMMYPDSFQILFNTFGYDDAYAGSENYMWLTEYQSGEGSMVGHMEAAVDDFKKLFDDGIMTTDIFDTTPSERSEMIYKEHSAAMIIECQNAVNYNRDINPDDDDRHDVAMMPFWTSDSEDGDYMYCIPSYYMGINKASAEESEEKKEILLDILEYLSTEEGQEMLIGDDFQVSNIIGVPLNENDFSANIIDTVQKGAAINTFYLAAGETNKQVERQLLSNVKDMVQGNISVEEWLLGADQVRDDFVAGNLDTAEVYGQVEETLTRLETAYTMADMYKTLGDADIGICLGGAWDRSTNGYLYQGDITDSTLACITPNKEGEYDEADDAEKIVTAKLTGEQILAVLNSTEYPSENSTSAYGLYPYYVASGLTVCYKPWAEDGERVVSCKLPDGSDIDTSATYTVAFYNGSLPNLTPEIESSIDMSWQDAFLSWLDKNGGTISKPDMTLTLEYE
jgi:ABC-type glycerol-3-phosphate transport system substrate-binding protein